MSKTILGLAGVLRLERRQILVDLRIGHLDLAVDLALAQALHDHLVADIFAILRVRDILALQGLAELIGGKLVLLRDTLDAALDECIVDLDPLLLRLLQQRTLRDQALEHLLVEDVGRRRLDLLLPQLLLHHAPRVVELILGQRLVVDDGDDSIDDDHAARRASRLRACDCRYRYQRGENKKTSDHAHTFRIPGNSRSPRRRAGSKTRCLSRNRAHCA